MLVGEDMPDKNDPKYKKRYEKAVSPSGIIHAARSGTRFRHFNATMLAAIR